MYVRLRIVGFYSSENIEHTTAQKKRDYMAMSNYATGIAYACALPHIPLIIIEFALHLPKLFSWI